MIKIDKRKIKKIWRGHLEGKAWEITGKKQKISNIKHEIIKDNGWEWSHLVSFKINGVLRRNTNIPSSLRSFEINDKDRPITFFFEAITVTRP
jgi:hypothetical protein